MRIETIDYHTAGEPFRIVTGGVPEIPGASLLERREAAEADRIDRIRRLLCHEPRGHSDMYGCFLVPPNDDLAEFGVLFWHKDGYSTACGHGTIALGTWAVDSGLVHADPDGLTDVPIDVPSGRVIARVRSSSGVVEDVTFRNVPSWVAGLDIRVDTAAGPVLADVSWGGAFYASVRADEAGFAVEASYLSQLIEVSRELKVRLRDHPGVRHPFDDRLSGLYGCIWWDLLDDESLPGVLRQRNVTVFADGEVDRSPCGSGTSARLAVLHERGAIGLGEMLEHQGIVGTSFLGTIVETGVASAGHQAVITEVTGQAFRTGEHVFTLDPRDVLDTGFTLR